MNNIKDHSSHLTTEQLLDYKEQRLSAVDAEYVENHLATDCTSCQAELSWLTQTLDLMGSEAWIDPPKHLQRSARQLFREHRSVDKQSFSLGVWFKSLWPEPRPLAFGLAAAMAIIIVAALVLQLWPGRSTTNQTEVAAVQGTVVVQEAGSDSWEVVEDDTSFETGDQIRTGDESSIVLNFPDDSQIIVAPHTELEILRVSSRPDGSQQVIVLHQKMGLTHNMVQPLPSPDSRFEIQTPSATITVRGTEFTVDVDSDGVTMVEVMEGIVEVEAQGSTVALTAGESTTVHLGDQPATAEATPTPTPTSQEDEAPADGGSLPIDDNSGIQHPATSTSMPLPATMTPKPSPTPETPEATSTHTATPGKNPTSTSTPTPTVTPSPKPTDQPTTPPTQPPPTQPPPTQPPPTQPPPTQPPPTQPPPTQPPPPPSPTPPPPPPPTDPPPPPSPTPPNNNSNDGDDGDHFVPPGLTKTPQPPGQERKKDN